MGNDHKWGHNWGKPNKNDPKKNYVQLVVTLVFLTQGTSPQPYFSKDRQLYAVEFNTHFARKKNFHKKAECQNQASFIKKRVGGGVIAPFPSLAAQTQVHSRLSLYLTLFLCLLLDPPGWRCAGAAPGGNPDASPSSSSRLPCLRMLRRRLPLLLPPSVDAFFFFCLMGFSSRCRNLSTFPIFFFFLKTSF